MEKKISDFSISSEVVKGKAKQLIVCPNCKQYNVFENTHKLTYQKIKTITCSKCYRTIQVGDIFNFTTGTKLHSINKHNNQSNLDNYIWNNFYDKI